MRIFPNAGAAQLALQALSVSQTFSPVQNGITSNDDLILFDAPAFVDPTQPSRSTMMASFEAFVFKRQTHGTNPMVDNITIMLAAFGVQVGDSLSNLVERARLFGASGVAGKSIQVAVQGCSAPGAVLSSTDEPPHAGLFDRDVSLGTCDVGSSLVSSAKVVLPDSDSRDFSASVFFYPDSGFGVISDVDDTIKITNVLHVPAMLKATFLDDPAPVAGMPELYASLSRTLSPHFFYVSGSMVQIQPFLHDFIHTTYSASTGPLYLRNLTSIKDLVNFSQGDDIFEFKSAMIDQIRARYPNKKFLAIGDSTQRDPEIYGEAFRKYGDFITCAWIREVDGANNAAARFAAAFKGMPSARWRLFKDSDIPNLASVQVAAGHC